MPCSFQGSPRDVKQEEAAKKHRKSSVTGTGKEPLSNVKRYGINEVLAAIGFIPETGDAFFEKLAKNWYARHRPARMLVTDDPEKSEEQFYYMIVDFVVQHGDAFWSREARGHLLNKGSNAYRPTNWRKGENISFLYPRDSVHRSSGVAEFDLGDTEEDIHSPLSKLTLITTSPITTTILSAPQTLNYAPPPFSPASPHPPEQILRTMPNTHVYHSNSGCYEHKTGFLNQWSMLQHGFNAGMVGTPLAYSGFGDGAVETLWLGDGRLGLVPIYVKADDPLQNVDRKAEGEEEGRY